MQDIPKETLIKAQSEQSEDISSFEDIYKAVSRFVYNVAFRVVNNKQDAEEITQDVFLKIYRSLKDFRFQSSFKTWVYRITLNCAFNHAKKRSRERNRVKEYGADLVRAGKTSHWADAGKIVEGGEDAVSSLLGALNANEKACMVLRSVEGLSYREISDTLKININTVRTRLKRAREKLMSSGKEVNLE
jgi:RNA polymerase sigma-70 factor (ECF subfamily)